MRCAEIRRRFVDYYHNLGFQLLPRAPMLHPSIPMSFVMSAGLVQVETSLANAKNRSGNKFVLVQDCFRHFDLNTIGKDSTHLSLFEMPGAFIFGQNGRFESIRRMWTLATEILGIPSNRLWATYFAGDRLGTRRLPSDQATYNAWREIGIPEKRLIGLGLKDNYWIQGGGMRHISGAFRKCGPNTELFFDRGQEYSCGPMCQPGCPCGGRFLEFSNSLFISFKLHPETHTLRPLDDPFTETVIGTERAAMILQQTTSVFATAFYQPIMTTIHSFVRNYDLPLYTIHESERVIADHLKALYVLVSDGAPPPGKNGRERIIKLLIRSIVTRQMLLDITASDFFTTLLHAVITSMSYGNGFHASAPGTVEKVLMYVTSESERFQKTIERAYRKMHRMLKKNREMSLSGQQVVELEKNWGLPVLLTMYTLREKGGRFKENDYKVALNEWRKSKNSRTTDN